MVHDENLAFGSGLYYDEKVCIHLSYPMGTADVTIYIKYGRGGI